MPKTAPDPIELKKHSVRQKLISIALIAALVGVTNAYMSLRGERVEAQKPKLQTSREDEGKILSESTEISAKAKDNFIEETTHRIQTTATKVESTTEELIDDTKEKVNTSLNELMYTTTIKPIINKIEALSPEQKMNIQEAICKPN